jgi:hypothetical protein
VKAKLEEEERHKAEAQTQAEEGWLTRGLHGNAHHEGLMVDGILQVSTRHRLPNKQKARFTQV